MQSDRFRAGGNIRTVAVVGAGLIGAGWVAAYLAHGLRVKVYDPSPEAAETVSRTVAEAWSALGRLGHLSENADLLAVSYHTELAEALDGADFIQENTPERQDVKLALYGRFDRLVPADVIIASSTSSMPVTLLQGGCKTADRCVLGHPFNPVHLMPLIEVGGGNETAPEAVTTATEFYRSIGKEPVLVQREIFGHIANRLTSAMFREAVSLVAGGYASVGDVDKAIRFGPALKWAVQGQFTTFHTSGGPGGLANFLEHFSPGIIKRWESMTVPDLVDPMLKATLVRQMEQAAAGRSQAEIVRQQDLGLVAILAALGEAEKSV